MALSEIIDYLKLLGHELLANVIFAQVCLKPAECRRSMVLLDKKMNHSFSNNLHIYLMAGLCCPLEIH